MEYLLILSILLASAVFMEKKYHIHLYDSRKERLIVALTFFTIGVIWDSFAIYRGHWIFPGGGILGIKIGLMPVEEYLFILILPFWIITTYKLLVQKIN